MCIKKSARSVSPFCGYQQKAERLVLEMIQGLQLLHVPIFFAPAWLAVTSHQPRVRLPRRLKMHQLLVCMMGACVRNAVPCLSYRVHVSSTAWGRGREC